MHFFVRFLCTFYLTNTQVKEYVLSNDFSESDKEYVNHRVDEIFENLETFWNEIPDIQELDMG